MNILNILGIQPNNNLVSTIKTYSTEMYSEWLFQLVFTTRKNDDYGILGWEKNNPTI